MSERESQERERERESQEREREREEEAKETVRQEGKRLGAWKERASEKATFKGGGLESRARKSPESRQSREVERERVGWE